MIRLNKHYLLASYILLTIEMLIALFAKDSFIRPIFGDYIASILLFCILATILQFSKNKLAIVTLLLSYLIEILQYVAFFNLINFKKYPILKIILGSSFSWMDIIAYSLGILSVLVIHNFKKIKSWNILLTKNRL